MVQNSGRLAIWQWVVLALPIASIIGFVLIAAGAQIHTWGISWIWAIITLMLVGWRWLLVRWTQPWLKQLSGAIVDLQAELDTPLVNSAVSQADGNADILQQADSAVGEIVEAAQTDLPIWEDWPQFWQRCQQVTSAIAHLYHPKVKYPLLNIHIPQAYGLIRGTVDDMDLWMQKLSPVLNQVSVGQAYQAYEVYRKLEPSARKLGRVWNWARWVWNPAAAAAQMVSQPYNNQATQQLLVNLSQSLREVALYTLAQQAIALYSGQSQSGQNQSGQNQSGQNQNGQNQNNRNKSDRNKSDRNKTSIQLKPSGRNTTISAPRVPSTNSSPLPSPPSLQPNRPVLESFPEPELKAPSPQPDPHTQTLRTLLQQAHPSDSVDQRPVRIQIVGRTGAGKSSVINTLFQMEQATVDVLPSTDAITSYEWRQDRSFGDSQWPETQRQVNPLHNTQVQLVLWDTPGYEQAERDDFRAQVLAQSQQADVLVLVTPALDPALQMDLDFLTDVKAERPDLSVFVVVTHVDRLRPLREWTPPYDWHWGTSTKEKSMREAIAYRAEALAQVCDHLIPLVTLDSQTGRQGWNGEELVEKLMGAIAPAKQLRLARFLRSQELRADAASQIIKSYTLQMTTTQGITALLKSPVLRFISTLTTGSPDLAYLLEAQIPVEQLPLVIGKLQMAYDLFNLFEAEVRDAEIPDAEIPDAEIPDAEIPDAEIKEPGSRNRKNNKGRSFNLLSLWPLLLENQQGPRQNAHIFGHAFVEHLIQGSSVEEFQTRFYEGLDQTSSD